MEMFEVGGCVRDELLGVPSKDIDFTVVMGFHDAVSVDPFKVMVANLREQGFKVFLESPEFLTVRAQFPRGDKRVNRLSKDTLGRAGLTADFVLARKESDYTDGRRPDKVEVGTLEDDLARRDFTMNAIAKDSAGNLIDPFGGRQDIEQGIIRAVGRARSRLEEDALRALRAVRFAVTKGFLIDGNLARAMNSPTVCDMVRNKISDERIQVELSKMFRFDTVKSMIVLSEFPNLRDAAFAGDVSLDATMKTKGRGAR